MYGGDYTFEIARLNASETAHTAGGVAICYVFSEL